MPKKRLLPFLREFVERYAKTNEHEESLEEFVTKLKRFIDGRYKRKPHVYWVVKNILNKRLQLDEHAKLRIAAILKENEQEKAESDRKQQQAVTARNENVHTFKRDWVRQVIQVLKEGELLESQFVALQLAIGCRERDLIGCRKQFDVYFRPYDQECVLQEGSCKRRNPGEPWCLVKKVQGMTPWEFLRLLSKFRSHLLTVREEKGETVQLNQKFSETTRLYFPTAFKNIGTHLNRAIYAAMCRWDAERENAKNFSAVRATQLAMGHQTMSTAPHYFHVRVS
jgi:hypothetical protein